MGKRERIEQHCSGFPAPWTTAAGPREKRGTTAPYIRRGLHARTAVPRSPGLLLIAGAGSARAPGRAAGTLECRTAGPLESRTARLCAAMCHQWPVPLCGEGTQCGVWVEQRAQWCMGVADGVWVSPPACAGESRGVRAAGPAGKAETGRAAARRVTLGGNGRVTAGRSAAVPVGSVWDFLGLSGLYTFRGSGWSFAVGAGWLGYSGGFSALV